MTLLLLPLPLLIVIDHSSTLLPTGNFFVPTYPAYPVVTGTFNAVVVGYTDDFVPSSSVAMFSSHHLPRGGFILRGLRGPGYGHRIAVLDTSEERSDFGIKCVLDHDFQILQGCMRGKNTTDLDCQDVSPLVCSDPSLGLCKAEDTIGLISARTYAKDHMVTENDDGLTSTRAVKLTVLPDGSTIVPDGEPFDITEVPYWNLGDVYEPVINYTELLGVNQDLCGYWFMPYALFELASAMGSHETGSAMVMDLPAKWSTKSFEALKDNRKSFVPDGNRFL